MKWWQSPEELEEEDSRSNIAKASEEYRNQLSILESFEKEGEWSGTGKSMYVRFEQLSSSHQTELRDGKELGSGRYGAVWKTPFRGVTLARKTIKLSRFKKDELELALNELKIVCKLGKLDRLDRHQHIVKIVGTCLQDFDPANWVNGELHILMFPVAHCDLAGFLDDCEEVSAPLRGSLTELPNRLQRLVSLGFHASKPAGELRHEIRIRLKEILGCLCGAVEWLHKYEIAHRDLKPANVLVQPKTVLVTDFGISRNETGARSTTEYHVGYTLGYAAPEVLQGDFCNVQKGDIYSLGCVFLHILTVVHGPNASMNYDPHTDHSSRDVSREKRFRAHVKNAEKDSLYEESTRAHQFLPPPLVKLLAGMMEENRGQRPSISEVNHTLRSLSNSHDHYFGSCCGSRPYAILRPGDVVNDLALYEPQAEALADEFGREPEPTSTAVAATDTATVDTSSALPSSTDPSAPYPTPDLPSNWWYSIENYSLDGTGPSVLTNIYKPGLGGNLKTKIYRETVNQFGDQYYQHWQFYAISPSHIDSNIVRHNPEGPKMLYRIAARNPGQETLLVLNNDDYMGWNKGTNTSSVDIRLDMITDQTNDGRFWYLEKIPGETDGYRIYNYKSGKKWWLVAEASTELGNEGIVYMTSEDKGSARWFMVKKEFIKPEYNWVV